MQRTVSNRAIARAAAEDQQPEPAFTFAKKMRPNPVLYADYNGHFWIGDDTDQPEGWIRIEQHCAYMSAYWLTHGQPKSLKFMDFDRQTQLHASRTVVGWSDFGGGLDAQVAYALNVLGGKKSSLKEITDAIMTGAMPPGTRIWFGNDRHVEAALVTPRKEYLHYDPNSGTTQTLTAKRFASYIKSKNAFVVSNA